MATLIVFAKLVLSAVLGGAIGIERAQVKKAAGMRTLALVTIGATLFTTMALDGFTEFVTDPSRIVGQVVVGIGFLGAGIIIFHHEKLMGLTTAAALWVAAAIGVTVGLDFYWIAIFVTVLTLCILHLLPHFDEIVEPKKKK